MQIAVLEGVSISYGQRKVLDDICFTAHAGEVVAIMGPSGSGKTTFLHVLGGLISPDSGRTVLHLGRTKQIAWIVQNSPLLPRRTSRENIALGALATGQDWDKAQQTAALLLEKLGLEHTSSTTGYRLSGGEKQRVAVGRAMAASAPLILADEPTASLDAQSRGLVCEALKRSASRGSSVIVSTHDEVVAASADSTLYLDHGRLRDRPLLGGVRRSRGKF